MSVRTELADGVLTIVLDNPPVNALGQSVRAGLSAAIDRIERDAAITAAVISGAGPAFCGGADIKEFGKPPEAPFLGDLLLRLEACRIPVVAAINGVAMGGGLETALACRYRIAAPNATFALPEVKLGLIPGAGGTQRLPRLVGIKRAAEMITSGKSIPAKEALAIGLVEEVADGDVVAAARAFLVRAPERRPLSEIANASGGDEEWFVAFQGELDKRSRGQLSPLKALEAVRASTLLPFKDGLKREREIFAECMRSDQRKGLIHAFFAERAVSKVGFLESVRPREVKSIGVLGSGTMGAGIAIACAEAAFEVRLFDSSPSALEKGLDRIRKTFEDGAAKGRISAQEAAARTGRVKSASSIADMREADLFIEAVLERMDVKQEVFVELDRIAMPSAVLATNTSYLNVDEIARATRRPQSVVGMHFFSPANVMRLLEVVRATEAAPDALATAMAVGKKLGKICVLAGVGDGFIGNRIFKRYRQQADYLLEEGALPQDVDRVMRAFGFAMGPFEVSDLAGLDIGWHNRRREDATRDPNERYVALSDQLYNMGRLGQKTGAGWYRYEGRTAISDPAVDALIAENSKAKGIARRSIGDNEIRDRILFAMINEGVKTLEEGVARAARDIDVVFIHGYGFPAYRGGPMFYGDLVGPKRVLEAIEIFARVDPQFWRPAQALVDMAQAGRSFSSFEANWSR
jgi:3-hydroxyacyl-CoA dehydrogenase